MVNMSKVPDETKSMNTCYGVIVCLIKDKEIYLSRRLDTPLFSKKWQLLNSWMRSGESSFEVAINLIDKETGITITRDRLFIASTISITNLHEFFYIYLVNLNKNECVVDIEDKYRSFWKAFPLNRAIVLDVVPAIRPILRKLLKNLAIAEFDRAFEEGEKEKQQEELETQMGYC